MGMAVNGSCLVLPFIPMSSRATGCTTGSWASVGTKLKAMPLLIGIPKFVVCVLTAVWLNLPGTRAESHWAKRHWQQIICRSTRLILRRWSSLSTIRAIHTSLGQKKHLCPRLSSILRRNSTYIAERSKLYERGVIWLSCRNKQIYELDGQNVDHPLSGPLNQSSSV